MRTEHEGERLTENVRSEKREKRLEEEKERGRKLSTAPIRTSEEHPKSFKDVQIKHTQLKNSLRSRAEQTPDPAVTAQDPLNYSHCYEVKLHRQAYGNKSEKMSYT